jgi:hypothetical protein
MRKDDGGTRRTGREVPEVREDGLYHLRLRKLQVEEWERGGRFLLPASRNNRAKRKRRRFRLLSDICSPRCRGALPCLRAIRRRWEAFSSASGRPVERAAHHGWKSLPCVVLFRWALAAHTVTTESICSWYAFHTQKARIPGSCAAATRFPTAERHDPAAISRRSLPTCRATVSAASGCRRTGR